MGLTEKLLAAALTGAVLGAVGCGSTSSQAQPTTPEGASGEKHGCKGEHSCKAENGCKGEHSCNGQAAPGGDASGTPSPEGSGEKASCKAQGNCHS